MKVFYSYKYMYLFIKQVKINKKPSQKPTSFVATTICQTVKKFLSNVMLLSIQNTSGVLRKRAKQRAVTGTHVMVGYLIYKIWPVMNKTTVKQGE